MKNEKEKKNITKSVKVSQNQHDIIMQKASEKHMNFSEGVSYKTVLGLIYNVQIPAVKINRRYIIKRASQRYNRQALQERLMSYIPAAVSADAAKVHSRLHQV